MGSKARRSLRKRQTRDWKGILGIGDSEGARGRLTLEGRAYRIRVIFRSRSIPIPRIPASCQLAI